MYFPPNSEGKSTSFFNMPNFRTYDTMKDWMLSAAKGLVSI
jgi:hypothetical protein